MTGRKSGPPPKERWKASGGDLLRQAVARLRALASSPVGTIPRGWIRACIDRVVRARAVVAPPFLPTAARLGATVLVAAAALLAVTSSALGKTPFDVASQTPGREYGDESDAQARATVRDQFDGLLDAPALRWPPVRVDEDIRGYLSDTRAVVADDTGRRGVMESTLPLRGETIDGDKAPIDLALMHAKGSSFAPRSSAAATRIPDDARGELRFPDQSFGVALAGAQQKDAVVQSNTLFYPNVIDDGDMVIEPRPDGAELSFVLRSSDAPTAIPLDFDLGRGQTLRTVGPDGDGLAPPRSLEVVGPDGDPVAAAYAPAAVDAAGASIPVRYKRRGDRVAMNIDTSVDTQWPVLVDPIIGVYDNNGTSANDPDGTTWPNWKPATSIDPAGTANPTSWSYCNNYSSFPNRKFYFCKGSLGGTSFDPGGAFVKANPNGNISYLASDWGAWTKKARLETVNGVQQSFTYIYQFDVAALSNSGENHEQTAIGIQKADGTWENGTVIWGNGTQSTGVAPAGKAAYQTAVGTSISNVTRYVKAGNGQPTPALTPGNSAIIKMDMTAGLIGANLPYVAVGGGATYSSEVSPPWFSSLSHAKSADPNVWYKTFTDTVSGTVGDHGLGMGKVTLTRPDATTTALATACPQNGAPANTSSAGASNEYDSCPLTLAVPNTTYTTAQQGVNRYALTATDLVGNQTASTWQVNLDNTGPGIDTPSGSLWEARNQSADHRAEGLYNASYTATVRAVDGSTTNDGTKRSGVHDIRFQLINSSGTVVVDSPDDTPQSCAASSCEKTRPWTLNTDNYADGDYTVNAIATDQAGNTSSTSWPVTIDRRGDVYHAQQFDAEPAGGGNNRGEEWAELGTQNYRHEDGLTITTRNVVSCPTDASGCAHEQQHTFDSLDDPTVADSYSTLTGTSAADPRMADDSELLFPANTPLGSVTSSGAINDALQPWQTPPPAHGSQYDLYATSDPAIVDGVSTSEVHRLWVDRATKLPLRDATFAGSSVDHDVYYTYTRSRQTVSELPSDEFAVPPPLNPGNVQNVQLPTDDDPVPADPPPTDDRYEESLAFRQNMGFNADPTYVHSVVDDPSLRASDDVAGVPLTSAEIADLNQRDAVAEAMDAIEDWGAAHPDVYGGTYQNQLQGGLVYVAFTSNVDSNLDAVKAVFQYPTWLRGIAVDHTAATLTALADRIKNDLDSGSLSGDDIDAFYIDDEANTVVVMSPNPTPELETSLRTRYATSAIVVKPGRTEMSTGPYSHKIPPLYGGLSIKFGGNSCSSAFGAYKDVNGRRVDFVTSAAHCQGEYRGAQANGIPWSHNGHHFGDSYASTFTQNNHSVRTDALSIKISPRYETNKVYYKDKDGVDHLRSIQHRSRLHSGEHACHSGAGVGGYLHCGKVTGRHFYYNAYGNHVGPIKPVSFFGRCETVKADSGGPVFFGSYARGIINTLSDDHPSDDPERCPAGQGDILGASQLDEALTDLRHLHLHG